MRLYRGRRFNESIGALARQVICDSARSVGRLSTSGNTQLCAELLLFRRPKSTSVPFGRNMSPGGPNIRCSPGKNTIGVEPLFTRVAVINSDENPTAILRREQKNDWNDNSGESR